MSRRGLISPCFSYIQEILVSSGGGIGSTKEVLSLLKRYRLIIVSTILFTRLLLLFSEEWRYAWLPDVYIGIIKIS